MTYLQGFAVGLSLGLIFTMIFVSFGDGED